MTNRAIEPLDGYTSLLGILEGATRRYPGRGAFGLFQDDGAGDRWTFEELDARSRAVAWRLRNEHSLARGDRLLTWSPDGEILVRGPGVFQGYWRNAEATSAAFSATASTAQVIWLSVGPMVPSSCADARRR